MKQLSIFKSIKNSLAREIAQLDDPRIPPDLTLTKIDFSRGYGKLDVYISSSSSSKKKTILYTMNIAKRRIISRALSGLRLRKIPKLDFGLLGFSMTSLTKNKLLEIISTVGTPYLL